MAARLLIPKRSDVWFADFGHVETGDDGTERYIRYREQGGKRPCVILSKNDFNGGWSELVVVAPITSVDKRYSTHVRIEPPEGGLQIPSFVIREGIRSIARQFLVRRTGMVEDRTMREIMLQLNDFLLFS